MNWHKATGYQRARYVLDWLMLTLAYGFLLLAVMPAGIVLAYTLLSLITGK